MSGMTQEELAGKLSVTRQTISHYESGISAIDLETAAAFCKLFQISLDELTDDVQEETQTVKNDAQITLKDMIEYGYDGVVTGFAADEKLLQHYCEVFGAYPLRTLHQFHFMIDEVNAQKIKETYTYEWTDAKL